MIAWVIAGQSEFALEGRIFVTGAVLQWLRDGLNLLPSAEANEAIAAAVSGSSGVYFVPAFVGLGAPHWNPYARGAAYLAGLAVGVWKSQAEIAAQWPDEAYFFPTMSAERREQFNAGWRRAIGRSKGRTDAQPMTP